MKKRGIPTKLHPLHIWTFVLSTVFIIGLARVAHVRSFVSYAASVITGNPHGVAGDLWSDIVLGKLDFNQSGANQVTSFKVSNPGGVIVDRNYHPNVIYVYDGGNSRILGYTSLGICSNDKTAKCSTNSDCGSGSCTLTKVKQADFVLGQPMPNNYNGCNNDGNMQNYPHRSPASPSTLCTIPERQNSPLEGGSFSSMAVDANHNLYVTDFFNNRVLKYEDPSRTDRVADGVWGQDNFSSTNCNKTDADIPDGTAIPNPTASSLCMGRNTQYQESFVAGVDIDPNGNLWVADSSNHRVLRFPYNAGTKTISKTADIVLGQPTFTTRQAGSTLAQMREPAALRMDPKTQWLYIADKGNNRILVFKPPFVSGMQANATFGSRLQGPVGLEFDPSGKGLWVSDNDNHMLELWDPTGQTVINVLFKDTYQPNGQCGTQTAGHVCKNPRPDGQCWDNMCDVRGSIGIDSQGNILVSGSSFNQDVWRFAAPIPSPQRGKTISADYRLFYPPDGYNYPSNMGLFSPRGLVVKNNQLIASDGFKIVFWNDPAHLTNGKPADGFAGVASFQDKDPWVIQRIAADDQHHLWVARESTIDVYQLPLVSGAKPIKRAISFESGLPVLGGGHLSWQFSNPFIGIDADPSGNYLWLSTVEPVNRVIRVRNPFTSPIVDVILGQKDTTGIACNRNQSSPGADTLCYPGAVKMDHEGNVWVSDHSLEFHGNKRILMFDKSLFTNITGTALFGPKASIVSPTVAAWEPAFDSKNHMVVGYNGQITASFPGIYFHPKETLTTTAAPDLTLKDYYSHGYGATFDQNDWLYMADLNRGRILIYKTLPMGVQPTNAPTPTPSPTPKPTGSSTYRIPNTQCDDYGCLNHPSGQNWVISNCANVNGSMSRIDQVCDRTGKMGGCRNIIFCCPRPGSPWARDPRPCTGIPTPSHR